MVGVQRGSDNDSGPTSVVNHLRAFLVVIMCFTAFMELNSFLASQNNFFWQVNPQNLL